MNLLALQRNLRDHLIQGSADIGREISGDSSARLAVYHYAYRAHLMDCLRDTFERVWTWLGDAGFETAGQKHIELHPPHGWTLADYGNGFDRTLKEPLPQRSRACRAGMARLVVTQSFRWPGREFPRSRGSQPCGLEYRHFVFGAHITYCTDIDELRGNLDCLVRRQITSERATTRSSHGASRLAGWIDPAFSQHRCSRAACTPYGNQRRDLRYHLYDHRIRQALESSGGSR